MRKTLVIVTGAVVVPALLLAALAIRKTGDQQLLLERQTAVVFQQYADSLAAVARQRIEEERDAFVAEVERLLAEEPENSLARNFSARLPARWPRAGVGFAVSLDGRILAPDSTRPGSPVWEKFLADHRAFLTNLAASEVYERPGESSTAAGAKPEPLPPKLTQRNVAPQQAFQMKSFQRPESKLTPRSSDFASAVLRSSSGTLTRFDQNRLEILFWLRPSPAGKVVFGALLRPEDLSDLWAPLAASHPLNEVDEVDELDETDEPGVCLAVLNERAEPVYRSLAGFETDWKLPFVASEIGEALPHWEVALYLTNPRRFTDAARWISVSLVLLVTLALSAISWGTYVVVRDTRREMELVQKKADFVSSVSHELKSPLTSIRLFSEMLEANRVAEPAKRAQFLRVIALEAERLTRLINNVLDFSRLEKGRKRVAHGVIDVYPVIQKTWEAGEAHLSSVGFATEWERADPPYPVAADPDAVAQILVNLLSNSEKYSSERKEVTLRTTVEDGKLCLSVLDRGIGVPAGEEERIFEPFHRSGDSLSSGIRGTGLGLALAQRLAAELGGGIDHRHREGGGSVFTLRVPLAAREGEAARA